MSRRASNVRWRWQRRKGRKLVVAVGFALLSLVACRSDRSNQRQLRIFAPSSLTEVARALGKKFEADTPGADVQLNLAGSQTLRLQIEQGAPVDVFVSASQDHMLALEEAGLMSDSVVLAENALVVVVPSNNPARVEAFGDLPRASRIVVGAPEVPVGKYTRVLLERAAVELGAEFRREVEARVVSREANVRLVLAKVELGEADAAIVYRTDVATARHVRAVAIPENIAPRAEYPVAIAKHAPEPELAARWVALARGPEGRALLEAAGFSVPP